MKKYKVYYSFNKHSEHGYSHHIVGLEHDWMETHDSYFYLADIELPDVDKETVIKAGVAEIEREILDLNMQIKAKKELKQQLLALEHKELS